MRPSKKDIKSSVDKLKDNTSAPGRFQEKVGKLSPKKTSQRIRKQGV